MTKKILAAVVALLVIVFPFRRAFLSSNQPDLMMMLSFLLTLIGVGVFYYLTLHSSKHSH